jgi:hypothetical protein
MTSSTRPVSHRWWNRPRRRRRRMTCAGYPAVESVCIAVIAEDEAGTGAVTWRFGTTSSERQRSPTPRLAGGGARWTSCGDVRSAPALTAGRPGPTWTAAPAVISTPCPSGAAVGYDRRRYDAAGIAGGWDALGRRRGTGLVHRRCTRRCGWCTRRCTRRCGWCTRRCTQLHSHRLSGFRLCRNGELFIQTSQLFAARRWLRGRAQ